MRSMRRVGHVQLALIRTLQKNSLYGSDRSRDFPYMVVKSHVTRRIRS